MDPFYKYLLAIIVNELWLHLSFSSLCIADESYDDVRFLEVIYGNEKKSGLSFLSKWLVTNHQMSF